MEDVCHESKIIVNSRRDKMDGCYEKLSTSQLSRILAIIGDLALWSEPAVLLASYWQSLEVKVEWKSFNTFLDLL